MTNKDKWIQFGLTLGTGTVLGVGLALIIIFLVINLPLHKHSMSVIAGQIELRRVAHSCMKS